MLPISRLVPVPKVYYAGFIKKALVVPPDNDLVIFCVKTNSVIDFCASSPDLAEQQRQHHIPEYGPDLVILSGDEAYQRISDAAKTDPVEITRHSWSYFLEVLPPVGWHADAACESFKMSERITGAITDIFVRLDDRYFKFADDIRLPHPACCARVKASKAFLEPSRAVSPEHGPAHEHDV